MLRSVFLSLFTLALTVARSQNFGFFASAAYLTLNGSSGYYNNTSTTSNPSAIGSIDFQNTNLGTYAPNSGNLVLQGAQIQTWKNTSSGNVCGATLFYTIYTSGSRPSNPVFNSIPLNYYDGCSSGLFPSGGLCSNGDQKWQNNPPVPDFPNASIDLTAFANGNYTIEIYYQISGSSSSTTNCDQTIYDNNNNSATNYTASFTISNVLPILLQNFSASYQYPIVELSWKVSQESNIDEFDIERSTDGKTFFQINSIQNNPGDDQSTAYNFSDNNPPLVGKVFYRLKMTDMNNHITYSQVAGLNLSGITETKLNAEISAGSILLHCSGFSPGNYSVQLYDIMGNALLTERISVTDTEAVFTIPFNQNIMQGTYLVRMINQRGENIFCRKMVYIAR